MSSTNKTSHYELSQYIGTDKPTYLGDYNSDMLAIDTAIYTASENASTAVSTANSAASAASDAATAASVATTTANNAADIANLAKTTSETASTNASAALTAAQGAERAAAANTITNLAPAYDPTLTYAVDDLVTYIDGQGSGKLYKCIVAVETPEAFNINKWDDVTTSVLYGRKLKLLASVTTDATTAIETILAAFVPYLSEIRPDSKLYAVSPDSTRIYNADIVGSTRAKFSCVDGTSVGVTSIMILNIEDNDSYGHNLEIASNGTINYEGTFNVQANRTYALYA